MVDSFYALSGFAVGLLVGMTGVGGGSLMTPLLILVFGINPATAVGTDLLFAAATKSAGSLLHGLKRSIEWQVVRRLAFGSVPATFATIIMLSFIHQSQAARSLITLILCGALLITATLLIFRGTIVKVSQSKMPTLDDRHIAMLTVLFGGFVGLLVSTSSIGAGAIGVCALVFLYPKLPMAKIIGSDIAHAVPLTLVAGAGHWMIGTVDWHILGWLLVGSVPGILGKNSIQLPEQALVAIAYLSGKERLNAIGFTHCREYQAQSDFSAPPRTSRPIPTPPRAQEFQIPPGLNFTLRLAAPIDLKRVRIGDEIAAVTGSPVKSKGKLIVPVGAHAAGRVRVLTPLDEQPNVLSVGFEFTEITFRDATGTAHHASFYARLSGLDPLPDVSMNMQRSQSLTSPHQFTQMFTTRTESVSVTPAYLPGVGSFLVENSLSQLPKGFGMRWITTSLASAR